MEIILSNFLLCELQIYERGDKQQGGILQIVVNGERYQTIHATG